MTVENKYNVGDIVLALAGRDSERIFVVVGILDENYVLIANGKSRKADFPKKKKIRHIELVKKADDMINLNLKNGKFTNAGLKKIISENQNINNNLN
jgi:ribosomal protein L14E/L6E/L27E